MSEQVIQVFRRAAAINRDSPLRAGNRVVLPADADALITGDLHGHGVNLLKIEKLAALDANPSCHVALQELIHTPTGPEDAVPAGRQEPARPDNSHHLLTRVARWQGRHPHRVHVILGNHELAQMTGAEILKSGGGGVCRAFTQAVRGHYRDQADAVLEAMYDYFRSLPLAVWTPGRLALVHSLPPDRVIDTFDASIFDRPIREEEYQRPGPVYQLVWGRSFGRKAIERIKAALDADVLVIGHLPQPLGVTVSDKDLLIIGSEHANGAVLRVGPGPAPAAPVLAEQAIRLNSIA